MATLSPEESPAADEALSHEVLRESEGGQSGEFSFFIPHFANEEMMTNHNY